MCCLQLPYGLIKEISSPGNWWSGDFKSFFTRFCNWWQIQVPVIQAKEGNKYLVLIQLFLGNSCRFIAKPCAINLGIQDSGPHRAQPNAILEKVFTSITKSPDGKRLEGLSKQLDWDVRKIQRWFRHRRNQDKPTTLTKFCESMYVCAEGLHPRALAVCSPLAGPGGSCSARPGLKSVYKQTGAVKGGFKIVKN